MFDLPSPMRIFLSRNSRRLRRSIRLQWTVWPLSRLRSRLLCPTRTRTSPTLPKSDDKSSLLRPTRFDRSRLAERTPVLLSSTKSSASMSKSEAESMSKRLRRLVDEKKALSDISSLRKMRKNFGQLEDSQKQIDDLRAKIKEIKDSMDDPEQKALSEQYNKIQAEIDAIKAEQDEAYKGISSLRDERSKLQAEQQEKYTAIRKLKDDYYGQKKAYQAYDREARERYREKQRAEQERYHQERKKAEAERRLGDASDPAYLDEIRRANSLLQFLDPNHKVEKGPLMADTGLGAQAQRSVDESGLKGTKLLRKEDRDEEYAPAVKKGKKGKKTAHGGSSNKFNVPPAVVEDCAAMGIDPPMSAADIPAVAEKVRAKLDFWKNDQEAQTQRNIEKAKKEIAELEAAEANGDKVEQTTADLKETSIADKQES
ncbi:uncharacterized protein BKA55DRAFT_394086 [Fusarium redolens]|uniref:Nuclear segregation protein n=1 Tax=Fusarium redolens TaxID=48865 RepID=A0A9P9K4I1_FUSRE|nr:uncharacterized protein BKA55DRAFT_394086 [Fusarium redolens]KAH7249027.1 hypothetical protein BKA55DRAFT_394086 [Fusarium redolens]